MNNDAVVATKTIVASVEHRIILERLAEKDTLAAGKPLTKPAPDWEWNP